MLFDDFNLEGFSFKQLYMINCVETHETLIFVMKICIYENNFFFNIHYVS